MMATQFDRVYRCAAVAVLALLLQACGGGGSGGTEGEAGNNGALSSSSGSGGTPATSDTQPPSAPASLRIAGATPGSIVLSWAESTDNVSVSAYDVYRNGSYLATVSAPTLVFVDSGVSPSTSYRYLVKAKDGAGNASDFSVEIVGFTPASSAVKDTQPPSAPGNVRAAGATQISVSVSWDAASDDVGISIYEIIRDGVQISSVSGSALSYTLTGLQLSLIHI